MALIQYSPLFKRSNVSPILTSKYNCCNTRVLELEQFCSSMKHHNTKLVEKGDTGLQTDDVPKRKTEGKLKNAPLSNC